MLHNVRHQLLFFNPSDISRCAAEKPENYFSDINLARAAVDF